MFVTTSNARLKYCSEMPISKNTMIRSTIFKRQDVSLFGKLCKFPNSLFRCSKIGSMIMKTRSKKHNTRSTLLTHKFLRHRRKWNWKTRNRRYAVDRNDPWGSRTLDGIFCASKTHQTANCFFFRLICHSWILFFNVLYKKKNENKFASENIYKHHSLWP